MPFLPEEGVKPVGFPAVDVPAAETTVKPETGEVWDAYMESNTLVSLARFSASKYSSAQYDPDPNYTPYGNMEVKRMIDSGVDPGIFSDDLNAFDSYLKIKRIERERKTNDTIQAAGAGGLAVGLATGFLDPVNVLPFWGVKQGAGAIVNAARLAAGGAAGAVAGEAVLHGTQLTRTMEDSAFSIGAATVLSGALGGAAGAIDRRAFDSLAEGFKKGLDEAAAPTSAPTSAPAGSTSGAMHIYDNIPDSMKGALGVERALQWSIVGSPLAKTIASPVKEVRAVAQILSENAAVMKGNADFMASPVAVESYVKSWQYDLYQGLQFMDRKYADYSKRIIAEGEKPVSKDKFKSFVSDAHLDKDTHPIPEVQKTATNFRKVIFDKLKDEAIGVGVFDKNVAVKNDPSYLTRVFNKQKIKARRPDFERIIADWLAGGRESARKDLTKLDMTDKAYKNIAAARAELEAARKAKLDTYRSASSAGAAQKAAEKESLAALTDQIKAEDASLGTNQGALAISQEPDWVEPFSSRASTMYAGELARLNAEAGATAPRVNTRSPRLLSFLVSNGGVKDRSIDQGFKGGDVSLLIGGTRGRPGLINNKSGMDLDDAVVKAWENGYFHNTTPDGGDRPTINDLLELIERDARGEPVHPLDDNYGNLLEERIARDNTDGYSFHDEIGVQENASVKEKLDALEAYYGRYSDYVEREAIRLDGAPPRSVTEDIPFAPRQADDLVPDPERNISAAGMREAADSLVAAARQAVKDAIKSYRGAKKNNPADADVQFAKLEDGDLDGIATEVTDNILGHVDGRTMYNATVLDRGPLKERTLSIPTAMVREFIEDDIEHILRLYVRTMASDVELTRAFGRADMRDQLASIRDAYAVERKKAGTPEQLKALDQRMRDDLEHIEAMRDRIRGLYGFPAKPSSGLVRTGRAIRKLNYLSGLGGVVITSIADVSSIMMTHGFGRLFGDALVPLITNMRAVKLAAREVRMMGTALDTVLDSRAMSINDAFDDFGHYTKAERVLDITTKKFGNVSFINYWNSALKQISGILSQTRTANVIRKIAAGDKVPPGDIERLANLGIDKPMALQIARQMAKYSEYMDGVFVANTKRWKDEEAVRAYRAAGSKEVDLTIVTPGQEKPLWMSTEMGAILGQMKTFIMSATTRVLVRGLQRRDAEFVTGAVTSIAMGMLSYQLAAMAAGRETSSNPRDWILEGLDRSGLLGWVFEANNLVEKSTRNNLGLAPLMGAEPTSRYSSRGALDSLLGPTFSRGSDVVQIIGNAAAGDWRRSDTHLVRRMLPFQNIFYLRRIFDQLEESVNDAFDVPERKR